MVYMSSSSHDLSQDEADRLRTVLRRIEKADYFDWILGKSHTKIVKGKIVSLDLSWLGIRYLPAYFLKELTHLRELRLDSNPRCEYEADTFSGVPELLAVKLKFCKLNDIPSHAFGMNSGVKNLVLENNPLSSLDESSFVNLNNLQMVDLSQCQINSLAPCTWPSAQPAAAWPWPYCLWPRNSKKS